MIKSLSCKFQKIVVFYYGNLYNPACKEATMAIRKTTKKAETETTTTANTAAAPKTTTRKTTTRKTTAKKTTARKAAKVSTEVYVQWLGKEVEAQNIIDSIKKIWTEEMGKKEADLKDLKIYIKPEDNGAHYVINGDITGFIEL